MPKAWQTSAASVITLLILFICQSIPALEISVREAMKSSIRHGDILAIYNLKTQQNGLLQNIAECMNESFGFVMNPSSRTRRNRVEVRLQWVGNKSIRAGIKIKYLGKAFPSIYIHRLFVGFDFKQDWEYIDVIYQRIINQNDGCNIILNQIETLPTIHNYPSTSDTLIFPIYAIFSRISQIHWSNATEIIKFLNNEFNFMRPNMFEKVTGRMILSKKVHKVRKKVWPLLVSLYKQRHEAMIYNRSLSFSGNRILLSIQAMLTGPKTHKDYKAFFMTMGQVIASVAVDKLQEIMRISNPTESFLEAEVRAEDSMNAFRTISMDNLNGDVHVFCSSDAHWDYRLIQAKLFSVLHRAPRYHPLARALSDLIVKVVPHIDYRNSSDQN